LPVHRAPFRKTRTLPGPKAKAWVERDRAAISSSYTRAYTLVVEEGRGAELTDVDGNVFLDMNAGIAVGATGHAHPQVVKAIQEQAARFLHMSGTDFYYPQEIRLAEKRAACSWMALTTAGWAWPVAPTAMPAFMSRNTFPSTSVSSAPLPSWTTSG